MTFGRYVRLAYVTLYHYIFNPRSPNPSTKLMNKTLLALAIALALPAAGAACAADAPAATPDAAADPADKATTLQAVEVNAKLDRSRNQLSPNIGASQYVIDSAAIERLPLGDATPLNQILLQAPGVVQ